MLQLNPPIPLETPKGHGYAVVLLDYSQEHDLFWVVLQDSGEVWTWRNQDVRACKNVSLGRLRPEMPAGAGAKVGGESGQEPLGKEQMLGFAEGRLELSEAGWTGTAHGHDQLLVPLF